MDTEFKTILLTPILLIILISCNPVEREIAGKIEYSNDALGNGSVEFIAMKRVMHQYCFSCHSEEQRNIRSDVSFFYRSDVSEDEFVSNYHKYFIPGDLSNSELAYRLKFSNLRRPSGIKTMPMSPLDKGFSQSEYKIFSDWIESLERKYTPRIILQEPDVFYNGDSAPINIGCTPRLPLVITYLDQIVARAICNDNSSYNFEPNFIREDGSHTIEIQQTNDKFNLIASSILVLNRDTAAPLLEVLSPALNALVGPLVTIQGRCEGDRDIQVSGDITSQISTPCHQNIFQAQIQMVGQEGRKQVRIRQRDYVGNEALLVHWVEYSALSQNTPAIYISGPISNIVQNSFQINGQCENELAIIIEGANGNLSCLDGRFAGELILSGSDGVKTIILRQTNAQGISGEATVLVSKDTTSPVLRLSSTIFNGLVVGSSINLLGDCEAGLAVNYEIAQNSSTLRQGQIMCSLSNRFSHNISFFQSGTYQVSLFQSDVAGNSSRLNVSLESDQTAPSITITSPTSNSSVADGFSIEGTCENDLVLELSFDNLNYSENCQNGFFRFENVLMGYTTGLVMLRITQSDRFHNIGNAQISLNFDPLSGLVTNFDKARYVLESKCLECHESHEGTTYGRFTNLRLNMEESQYLEEFSELIVRGDAENSEMIRRFFNAGGDMPEDAQGFSPQLYQAVFDWIDNLFVTPVQIVEIENPLSGAVVVSPVTVSGTCAADNSININAGTISQVIVCDSNGRFRREIDIDSLSGEFSLTVLQNLIPLEQHTSSITLNIVSVPSGEGREPATVEEIEALDNAVDIRLADKQYIANVFRYVFGPESREIVQQNIISRPTAFGGICNFYESETRVNVDSQSVEFPDLRCFPEITNIKASESSLVVPPSTVRAGMRIKTCDQLVENAATLSYAMNLAQVSMTASLNDERLQSVYALFYPFDILEGSILQLYRNLNNQSVSNTEKWKDVVYATCTTPNWQIP